MTETALAPFLSITWYAACSAYFWIFTSRLTVRVFPATGSSRSSAAFSTSTPLASDRVRIFPSRPFKYFSYMTSRPMIPWLSAPVKPRTREARLS